MSEWLYETSLWFQIIGPILILGSLFRVWWYNWKTYKSIREEMDRIEKELGVQAGAFVHVRSRLDQLEGKKFLLRNVQHHPLPQPRNRSKDGE